MYSAGLDGHLAAPQNVAVIAAAGISPAGDHAPTILLVDDDASVIDTFKRLLELEGFEIASSQTATRGFDVAMRIRPTAIILDVRMPIVSGIHFLRQIRAQPTLASTPVAIVTGDYFLSEIDHLELSSLGAAVRFKPLWADELAALARTLVLR